MRSEKEIRKLSKRTYEDLFNEGVAYHCDPDGYAAGYSEAIKQVLEGEEEGAEADG